MGDEHARGRASDERASTKRERRWTPATPEHRCILRRRTHLFRVATYVRHRTRDVTNTTTFWSSVAIVREREYVCFERVARSRNSVLAILQPPLPAATYTKKIEMGSLVRTRDASPMAQNLVRFRLDQGGLTFVHSIDRLVA